MKILRIIEPKDVLTTRPRFHASCTECDWNSIWAMYVETVELVARDHAAGCNHRVVIAEREPTDVIHV